MLPAGPGMTGAGVVAVSAIDAANFSYYESTRLK